MKKVEKLPKVSIVFSNFNGGKEPIDCLNSIEKLNYPKNKIEVTVIDNGSQDGSSQIIAKKFPDIHLIKLEKDIGLPASLNLGIVNSSGKYIFIGNDDTVLEKNSIRFMVNYLEVNKNVAVLGGKVYYKYKPKKLSLSVCGFNYYLGSIRKPKDILDPNQVQWFQSCAIMIPSSVFKKIGLFDSGFYPLYFDDFDFCLRATKAGFKITYLPQVIFWHGQGKTTQKFPSKKVYYWWYKNKIRFYFKHASLLQMLTAFTLQFFATASKSISTRQNIFPSLFKAYFVNLISLPAIISQKKENGQSK